MKRVLRCWVGCPWFGLLMITPADALLGTASWIAPEGFILVPACRDLCSVFFSDEQAHEAGHGSRTAPFHRLAPGPAFNLSCPVGRNGVRCVAGCTPVAAAQTVRHSLRS